MRNLMIGAVSAVALMAGTALAQTGTSTMTNPTVPSTTTSPSAGSTTSGPGTMTPGTAGSSGAYSGTSSGSAGMSGSSGWSGQTVAPGGLGSSTSSTIPRDNQTATGTHCPPGTPNCGPDQGNGGGGGQ